MNTPARWATALVMASASAVSADNPSPKTEAYKPSTVSGSSAVPPRVVPPCKPGRCPFAGQSVTMLIVKEANAGALGEMKNEFEAATGATAEPRPDVASGSLSELHLRPDQPHRQVRRRLCRRLVARRAGGGRLHRVRTTSTTRTRASRSGTSMTCCRRRAACCRTRARSTWWPTTTTARSCTTGATCSTTRSTRRAFRQQVRLPARRAEDLGAVQGRGRILQRQGSQRRRRARSRPVHAPEGRRPGHVPFHVVLGAVRDRPGQPDAVLVRPEDDEAADREPRPCACAHGAGRAWCQFGPKDMLNWDLGQSWDHFLAGRAALTFTWGDLGALAQEKGSKVKGKIGVGAAARHRRVLRHRPAQVGHDRPAERGRQHDRRLVGGRDLEVFEGAGGDLLPARADGDARRSRRSMRCAAGTASTRGARSTSCRPTAAGSIEIYLNAGWNEADVRDYLHAYFADLQQPAAVPLSAHSRRLQLLAGARRAPGRGRGRPAEPGSGIEGRRRRLRRDHAAPRTRAATARLSGFVGTL